jgi:hypothetical protein
LPGFRGFVKANPAIVGVSNQLGELFLAEIALHLAAEAAGAESEARHLDVGFAERDPFRGRIACNGLCW